MMRSSAVQASPGAGLAAVMLALLASCAPAFSTDCRVDRDCPADFRCDPQLSVCVAAGVDAGDAAVIDGATTTDSATPVDATTPVDSATAPDAGHADARRTDAASADLTGRDQVRHDHGGADQAASDHAAVDQRRTDSAGLDAAIHDSAHADAARADTRVPDSRINDASTADTVVPDTAIADTRVADTSAPDAAVVDGASADSGCPGCKIQNVCYGAGTHNPLNACEVCDPGQPQRWTRLTGQVCAGDALCTCSNGIEVGSCVICRYACDSTAGRCCGFSQEACCTDAESCQTGLTCNGSNVCANAPGCGVVGHPCCGYGLCVDSECDSTLMCVTACGSIGGPCCYPAGCYDAESFCCCGSCTTNPSSCDAC